MLSWGHALLLIANALYDSKVFSVVHPAMSKYFSSLGSLANLNANIGKKT